MQSILEICDPAKGKEVPPGTVLLSEGSTSGHIYVLAEGRIEAVRGNTQVAIVSEPGSVFGEMSVLLNTPHTATVRALSPVTVYAYAYADAAGFMRSDPQIAFIIARLLAQRLNSATTYLVDLKRQYAGQGNHLGIDVLASLIHQQEAEFTPGSDRLPDPAM